MSNINNNSFEELIKEVKEYYDLPAGWDNESDKPTCKECLDKLLEFCYNFLNNQNIILPETSIATDDEVALFWDIDGLYLIIHFYPNKYRFYFHNRKNEISSYIVQEPYDTIDIIVENYIKKYYSIK